MGNDMVFPTRELRQEFCYRSVFIKLRKDGKPFMYPVIVLYKASTMLPVFFTGLERYIIDDYFRSGYADSTIRKRVFCILEFLNWVLHETLVPGLDSLTIDDLRDFLSGQSNREDVGRDYWYALRETVARFLKEMIDCVKDVRFCIRSEDLIREESIYSDTGGSPKTICEYNSFGVKAPGRKQIKNRYLPYEWLEPFLEILRKVHPELVLAVALQAYGGLREGEVVNVSFKTLSMSLDSLGACPAIEIDLEHEAGFWKDLGRKTNPGKIKKPRIQRIYPDFTKEVFDRYSAHLKLMKERELPIQGDNPLFVDSRGNPLTVQRYSQIIREVFEKHFITYIGLECHKPEFDALLDIYVKEYPGAHMFRHWFTMYLLTKARNGGQMLDHSEIMKWRGDSNITSMNDYIHENHGMIDAFRGSVSSFQQKTILNYGHHLEEGSYEK